MDSGGDSDGDADSSWFERWERRSNANSTDGDGDADADSDAGVGVDADADAREAEGRERDGSVGDRRSESDRSGTGERRADRQKTGWRKGDRNDHPEGDASTGSDESATGGSSVDRRGTHSAPTRADREGIGPDDHAERSDGRTPPRASERQSGTGDSDRTTATDTTRRPNEDERRDRADGHRGESGRAGSGRNERRARTGGTTDSRSAGRSGSAGRRGSTNQNESGDPSGSNPIGSASRSGSANRNGTTGIRDRVRWVLRTDHAGISFAREVLSSLAIVAAVGLLLFAVSGIWPPMVAVESQSMTPNLKTGDLVFVMEEHRFAGGTAHAGTGVVTYQTGENAGYTSLGKSGDVIIYRPNGVSGGTPIIHRARFWVNQSENWYDKANPDYLGGAEACEIDSDPDTETGLSNCPAPHAGFITKGDSNARYDQVGDNPITGPIGAEGRISAPVKPEWITGTGEFRIPKLGCVRLWFAADTPEKCTL